MNYLVTILEHIVVGVTMAMVVSIPLIGIVLMLYPYFT